MKNTKEHEKETGTSYSRIFFVWMFLNACNAMNLSWYTASFCSKASILYFVSLSTPSSSSSWKVLNFFLSFPPNFCQEASVFESQHFFAFLLPQLAHRWVRLSALSQYLSWVANAFLVILVFLSIKSLGLTFPSLRGCLRKLSLATFLLFKEVSFARRVLIFRSHWRHFLLSLCFFCSSLSFFFFFLLQTFFGRQKT